MNNPRNNHIITRLILDVVKKKFVVNSLFFLLICGYCSSYHHVSRRNSENDEDDYFINQSFQDYPIIRSREEVNLPGPEFSYNVTDAKPLPNSLFIKDNSGNYLFKSRATTEFFSYNDRYELGVIQKIGDKEVQVVNGQFTQLYEKKSEGYYIRTIGYIADEDGFQPFLIDLSKTVTMGRNNETGELSVSIESLIAIGYVLREEVEGPGAPKGMKGPISSTILGTIVGSNTNVCLKSFWKKFKGKILLLKDIQNNCHWA